MSAEVRATLAGQVETVDGLSCTPYYRQTTKAGDAMVRLDRIRRADNGFGYMATWQVLLILPQDIETAEKYMESKVPALAAALSQEMVVTTITPQELVLDNGIKLPCVVLEGARDSGME